MIDEQAIAIVGMAGRFPGAHDLATFWGNLCGGVESIRRLDGAELDALGVSAAARQNPHYVPASAALEGMELFDAAFFGFSPREAELMDPQHRVFLELCWEALERAGHVPAAAEGAPAVGVFAGASTNTYLLFNLAPGAARLGLVDPVQIDIASGSDFLCTRVAYKLGLRGPSYSLASACSTSLVAVHVACQSLLAEECDLALAGGVSIQIKHREGYLYMPDGIVSPDGHCRPFDAAAGGTVFGSGAGVILLRRLRDALDDGDHVHAVIRGTAINNDGAHKVGYTAPSVEGQAAVIREALDAAGVEPDSIGYVETHGTGTRLGDPIEIRALARAFGPTRDARSTCALGSLKSNIGHLANAAGVASLIKAALALEHRRMPPSLHFERPNPEIDLGGRFRVQACLADWPEPPAGAPRRAGVSSFGVGGTNAHVVLEEPPARAPSGPSRPVQLLPLSARTPAALDAAAAALARHLEAHPGKPLADVAYTLQVGRQAMPHRRVVVCGGREQAIAALDGSEPGRALSGTTSQEGRPVAFLFPGQGAQYVGMAGGLYRCEPYFRAELDACADRLRRHLGVDLRGLLFPGGADEEAACAERLGQTAITQPALFAVEYALARLLMSWGIQPCALLGHSVGELVAACLAGVFSLEDALALVAARGRLMQEMPPGAMLSVALSEGELASELGGDLSVAAVNAPSLTVVAGSDAAIGRLEARLVGRGVVAQRLHTSHAFHSPMMDRAATAFAAELRRVRLQAPALPIVSDATGEWLQASEATDPDYWARHIRRPVRFAAALARLAAEHTGAVLLEVGPGQVLGALARQQPALADRVVVGSTRRPRESTDDQELIFGALGRLWLSGVAVDWRALCSGERRRRLPLPSYPFERRRFWIDAPGAAHGDAPPGGADESTLDRRPDIADWFYVPSWKRVPVAHRSSSEPAGTWLLFADQGGVADALAARLTAAGHDTILVARGERFGRTGAGAYAIAPARREDHAALFADLRARGTRLAGLVHLWSLRPEIDSEIEGGMERGFYSLAALAGALGERRVGAEPIRCWVVASAACAVESADPLCPERAMALGACRVLPQELPGLVAGCCFVDVAPGDLGQPDQVAARLALEIATGDPDPVVAWRGRQRWVQTFEPLRLPPAALGRGAYLVSEGLSGVGRVLTGELARIPGVRLALLEGEDVPLRERWDAEAASRGPNDPIAQKIGHARALEARTTEGGGDLVVVHADLADQAKVAAALASVLERFSRLDAVVHAAGGMAGAGFQLLGAADPASCAAIFAPRVRAVRALERALPADRVGVCMLVSSLASVLGGVGQAAHAAAALYMDAVAERASQAGRPWISVDWDAWRLGADQDDGAMGALLARLALSDEEGVEATRRVLASAAAGAIVVSTAPLDARRELVGRTVTEARAGERGERPAHPRPALATTFVAPRSDAERSIAAVWERILGVAPVGIDDNFFDLGGNSLIAVQAIADLGRALGSEVSVATLYQRATVRALAELLDGGDQAAAARAEKLARRKQELGRRNEWLRRRRG